MRKLLSVALIAVMLCAWSDAALAQSLIVALDTPPRTMNPHGSDADANLSRMANIFDGLLQRKGPEGELVPALAERWEHPDTLTWKFYLRQGVKFHNGNPFTAEDVKFSFERLSDPEVSEFINSGKTIESIDILDDYTVVVKTKNNIPWFANNMHQIFIMDKESTESRDPGEVGLHPIGTGAYKFVEWVKGSYLKLEANEDYWEGSPQVKQIEERPITEASTRFASLVSGQVDIVCGVPVELYEKVVSNPKLQVLERPARRAIFLSFHNKPGSPTADVRVRQAMYMAIDEDEIIEKVMHGHATPAAQIPDPPTIGYNADIQRLPYDLEKAKELMKEAGYENGFDIRLSGPNDRYVNDAKIAEAVAKYLAKIGINVELDVKPKSIFFEEVAEGTLDFYLIGWFDGTFDMGRTFFTLIHSREDEYGYGSLNGSKYSEPEIDTLLQATTDIVDPAEREKVLQQLNALSIEKVACIPLHYQQDLYAIQKDRGIEFIPRPDQWMVYKEMKKQ